MVESPTPRRLEAVEFILSKYERENDPDSYDEDGWCDWGEDENGWTTFKEFFMSLKQGDALYQLGFDQDERVYVTYQIREVEDDEGGCEFDDSEGEYWKYRDGKFEK